MKNTILFLFLFLPSFIFSQEVNKDETMPFFSMKGYNSKDASQNIYKYIQDNLGYPEKARDNCQSGTIMMTFTIDSLGNVAKDSLWYEHYPLLVERVRETFYSTSGHWTPATKDGKKTESKMTLPFQFNLRGAGCKTDQEFFQIGLGLFENEDFVNATKAFQLAFRIKPTNTDYIFNTAVGYLKQYKIDSACQYLSMPVKSDDIENLRIRFCEEEK